MSRRSEVYRFRIALREIEPPIWRVIEVPATYSFWDLHVAIQDSMGWKDCHLHMFRVPASDGPGVVEIGIPDEDAFVGDEPILPGWDIPIAEVFEGPGAVVDYEYDFGDSWSHEVLFEAVAPRVKGRKYPRCVGGDRACPPEDCGGVPGYEELLSVLFDPLNPEFENTRTWLGGSFDPEGFVASKVKFDSPRARWKYAFGSE